MASEVDFSRLQGLIEGLHNGFEDRWKILNESLNRLSNQYAETTTSLQSQGHRISLLETNYRRLDEELRSELKEVNATLKTLTDQSLTERVRSESDKRWKDRLIKLAIAISSAGGVKLWDLLQEALK